MSDRITLLLTSWYFPVKIIRWQDAAKMIYEETVDVIAEYAEELRSPSVTWKMPAVVRLRREVSRVKRGIKFSRSNVYTRDKFVCQYCDRGPLPIRALSYDHVVPRSAGGKTTWENIVTCCRTCNSVKDDHTCDEVGMWPIKRPRKPSELPMSKPLIDADRAPQEWAPFLS